MWNGIMQVLKIQHRDKNNNVLWEEKKIKNLLHFRGEEWLLRAAFTGGRISDVIPENYYLGLDNRPVLEEGQEMSNLVDEPTFAGYERQPVASTGDFSVVLENGHYQAISPIVAFGAEGGTWGPVKNLFLTDSASALGTLISSASLSTPIILDDSESVTLRIAMSLKDCS